MTRPAVPFAAIAAAIVVAIAAGALPLVAIGHLDVNGGGQLNRFGADFVQHGTPNLPPSHNAFM